MKKNKIINSKLIYEISKVGHTQYIVIADAGLPIPKGVNVIDLAIVGGLPSFIDVLDAVVDELIFEKIILASEIQTKNKDLETKIVSLIEDVDIEYISHEKFKILTLNANVIVRTGEKSPYANIILVGGVDF